MKSIKVLLVAAMVSVFAATVAFAGVNVGSAEVVWDVDIVDECGRELSESELGEVLKKHNNERTEFWFSKGQMGRRIQVKSIDEVKNALNDFNLENVTRYMVDDVVGYYLVLPVDGNDIQVETNTVMQSNIINPSIAVEGGPGVSNPTPVAPAENVNPAPEIPQNTQNQTQNTSQNQINQQAQTQNTNNNIHFGADGVPIEKGYAGQYVTNPNTGVNYRYIGAFGREWIVSNVEEESARMREETGLDHRRQMTEEEVNDILKNVKFKIG